MAPAGTPIVAARSGTVSWVSTPADNSCGYCLFVDGDDGRTYGYIHMGPNSAGRSSEAFTRSWSRGDRIDRGQEIGYVGCSGNATCGDAASHSKGCRAPASAATAAATSHSPTTVGPHQRC